MQGYSLILCTIIVHLRNLHKIYSPFNIVSNNNNDNYKQRNKLLCEFNNEYIIGVIVAWAIWIEWMNTMYTNANCLPCRIQNIIIRLHYICEKLEIIAFVWVLFANFIYYFYGEDEHEVAKLLFESEWVVVRCDDDKGWKTFKDKFFKWFF